jgi:hypothetical protein
MRLFVALSGPGGGTQPFACGRYIANIAFKANALRIVRVSGVADEWSVLEYQGRAQSLDLADFEPVAWGMATTLAATLS